MDLLEFFTWFLAMLLAHFTGYVIYDLIARLVKRRGGKLRGHKVLKKHLGRLIGR